MKFFALIAMCALHSGAFADWRLTMAPASVQVDFGAPGLLEIRIRNTGNSVSPAQNIYSQGFQFGSVASNYEITPLSGGCGNWQTVSFGFTGQVATQFSIPEVLPQNELKCQFNFVARRTNVGNFQERFRYLGLPSELELGTIKIGGLTDLGATANLISARQINGQSINRYRLNVNNFGQLPVEAYGFSTCNALPSFTVDTNFAGGCSTTNSLYYCGANSLFGLSAGPIQSGQRASCEFETTGSSSPDLSAIRLSPRITRPLPDTRLLLDINPENDVLRLVAADPIQVPTLSWLGLMGLIVGVALVARHAK